MAPFARLKALLATTTADEVRRVLAFLEQVTGGKKHATVFGWFPANRRLTSKADQIRLGSLACGSARNRDVKAYLSERWGIAVTDADISQVKGCRRGLFDPDLFAAVQDLRSQVGTEKLLWWVDRLTSKNKTRAT